MRSHRELDGRALANAQEDLLERDEGAARPHEAVEGVGALIGAADAAADADLSSRADADVHFGRREAMKLPIDCPNCSRPGHEVMCVTDIPHFKEVIIMAFDCEYCG